MIRSSIIILLILLSFPKTSQAQSYLGIKGSRSLTWVSLDPDVVRDRTASIRGFGTGLTFYHRLGDHLRVGIEPSLIRRGYRFFAWYDQVESGYDNLYDIIELPLLVSIHSGSDKSRIQLYAKGGWGVSWAPRLQKKVLGSNPSRREIPLRSSSYFNRWDAGLYAGLGMDIKAGPGRIMIGGESYTGLLSIYRFNSSYLRNLSLVIGYSVGL